VAGGLRKFFQTKQITLPSLLNERGHTWKVEIKKGNVGSESNLNIEDKTMNKIILTIFLLLTTSTLLLADDVIYDKP
jgi:hypothetical protein